MRRATFPGAPRVAAPPPWCRGPARLIGKVRNEIVIEIDRAQIEPRLAFTRENYRMMREELLKIVYWCAG
jgi:hypothetical protein